LSCDSDPFVVHQLTQVYPDDILQWRAQPTGKLIVFVSFAATRTMLLEPFEALIGLKKRFLFEYLGHQSTLLS
jgi:hypothetical protein